MGLARVIANPDYVGWEEGGGGGGGGVGKLLDTTLSNIACEKL